MKFFVPLLAVLCFTVVGCKSHSHGGGACCGTDGKCCKEAAAKTCPANCDKPCCKKAE